VNIDEYFFFEGRAQFKCHGNHLKYLSEKTNEDHYVHRSYYDVEVDEVKKITSQEFTEWPKRFQLSKIKDNLIIVDYNKNKYQVNTDILYVHDTIYARHSQIEDDNLHSDFNSVPIIFKLHKSAQLVRCIPNFPTGKYEMREDGRYKEYTTGAFESDGETCATEWRKEPIEVRCVKDAPTGNREDKENCYRLEYYTGEKKADGQTCETYWGEWACDDTGTPIPPGAPLSPSPSQPPGCWSGIGCTSVIIAIIAFLWALLCIRWAIIHHSFLPILFGIGIPLFLFGFGYLVNFLGRFTLGISRFFSWILQLLLLIGLLGLLNGFFSLFDGINEDVPQEDTRWTEQNVEDVDPFVQTETEVEDSTNIKTQGKRIHLKWVDFDKNKYQGSFLLTLRNLRKSTFKLKELEQEGLRQYADVYREIYQTDNLSLKGLYRMLDSIQNQRGQNRIQFAYTVMTMVQSIKYELILDKSCDDPYILRNQQIRELIRSGIDCNGFAPYGIRTPVEFLASLEGDCDTRTLLLYTIFKHYNYDVAIINSDVYGHSMLGLSIPKSRGVYKLYQGKRYFFWETTSYGNRLGELDRSVGNINYWKIELN
jgi:hypothetical protein